MDDTQARSLWYRQEKCKQPGQHQHKPEWPATEHGKISNLHRAPCPTGPSIHQWMMVHPGMASPWLPSHGRAHHCVPHASHFHIHLSKCLFNPAYLHLAIPRLPWSSCPKHPPSSPQAPMIQAVTCKEEEAIWQEETILWDHDKKKKKKKTKNANTNLPVSMGRLPGWLLCGKSPLRHLPPTLQAASQAVNMISSARAKIRHHEINFLAQESNFEQDSPTYLARFDPDSFCIGVDTLCTHTLSGNKEHFKDLHLYKGKEVTWI